MGFPVLMRTLFSVAALFRWRLTKMDGQSAFLKRGKDASDFYGSPLRESCDSGRTMWRLFTAVYGVFNANEKWQTHSDDPLCKLGFSPTPSILQLFVLQEAGSVLAILANIVDDMLISAPPELGDLIVKNIDGRCKLGTVPHVTIHNALLWP